MKRLWIGALALLVWASPTYAIDIPGPGDPVDLPGPGGGEGFSSVEGDTTAAACTWQDAGPAWVCAGLHYRAVYIKVSDATASGSIVIRFQGSITGAAADFQDIITAKISDGSTYAYTDTLQFVLPNTGVPFTTGRWLSLDEMVYANAASVAADGALTRRGPVLNAFAVIRAVVINRGPDAITTSIRFTGQR